MSFKKIRKSRLLSTSDVLQSLLQNSKSPLSQGFTRWRLWHNWSKVVGESVAAHSNPVGYSHGTLYVWVDSSVRMQEMIFLIKPIRKKINDYIGKKWVNGIRFTLDPKNVPSHALADPKMKEYLEQKSEGKS